MLGSEGTTTTAELLIFTFVNSLPVYIKRASGVQVSSEQDFDQL